MSRLCSDALSPKDAVEEQSSRSSWEGADWDDEAISAVVVGCVGARVDDEDTEPTSDAARAFRSRDRLDCRW